MEHIPVPAVHVDEVCGIGIMIAAALVPNGPGGDDNSTVLNGPVQYPAVAEEDELFQAHGNQILKVPDAGGFPYSGLIKGNALAPVVHGIHRCFPIGSPYPTDTLRLKKGKNGLKQMVRKAGDGDFRQALHGMHAHLRVNDRTGAGVKFG